MSFWNRKNYNTEYLRTEHWIVTTKIFRREMGASGCIVCHMTSEEHWEQCGRALHVHHRNYNFKGCERWCDLELLCENHHNQVTAGTIILTSTPSNPSTEFIHADDPIPEFPVDFGWWTKEDRDEYLANQARRQSRPLQVAAQMKEEYALVPPKPAAPTQEELQEQERQRIRKQQQERLQALNHALEEALEALGKRIWKPFYDGLEHLKIGLILPVDMRALMQHYENHVSSVFRMVKFKQDEIAQVCPQYQRINMQRMENKLKEGFASKANGQDAPKA